MAVPARQKGMGEVSAEKVAPEAVYAGFRSSQEWADASPGDSHTSAKWTENREVTGWEAGLRGGRVLY